MSEDGSVLSLRAPGREKPPSREAEGLIQSLSEAAGFGARRKMGEL